MNEMETMINRENNFNLALESILDNLTKDELKELWKKMKEIEKSFEKYIKKFDGTGNRVIQQSKYLITSDKYITYNIFNCEDMNNFKVHDCRISLNLHLDDKDNFIGNSTSEGAGLSKIDMLELMKIMQTSYNDRIRYFKANKKEVIE